MLSDPIYSSFRTYIPKNFINEATREKFGTYFSMNDLPYSDIMDYINSTIINSKLPGIEDKLTSSQIKNFTDSPNGRGGTRKFQSALQPKESVEKTITIDFKLKNSYLNWVVLRANMEEYLKQGGTEKKSFLPNIYLQILDDEDNIIIELIHKEVLFSRLDPIEFRKQDNGLLSKTFSMVFEYNDFEIKINMDKIQSNRDSSLHEY